MHALVFSHFITTGAQSAYKEFDFEGLKTSMGGSWVLNEDFQNLRDASHMNQSVFNFFPIPSVHAKSSSEDDIKKLIVRNILVTLCNMSKCQYIYSYISVCIFIYKYLYL
jgi:hypothetical protein